MLFLLKLRDFIVFSASFLLLIERTCITLIPLYSSHHFGGCAEIETTNSDDNRFGYITVACAIWDYR